MSKQLTFISQSDEFKDYWRKSGRKVHGGVYSYRKRKTARPFSTKKPLHLVVRALRAKGELSMWNHKTRVMRLLYSHASINEIKIYRFSNNGNHLHILLRAYSHAQFKNFLRSVTGLIARLVLNAKKGTAKGKFWDALAFTRIADWGRSFENLQEYVLQNILEAAGVIPFQIRRKKLRPAPT